MTIFSGRLKGANWASRCCCFRDAPLTYPRNVAVKALAEGRHWERAFAAVAIANKAKLRADAISYSVPVRGKLDLHSLKKSRKWTKTVMTSLMMVFLFHYYFRECKSKSSSLLFCSNWF